MREIKVVMPLIRNLSVNHYLGRNRYGKNYVKREVVEWKEALGWQIKTAHIEDWKLPLTVRCDLIQNDNRVRDCSNYSKVVLDSLEEASGVNDTNMRWQDGDILVRRDEQPTLVITIKENK